MASISVNFCTKEGKANSESSIEVTIQQKWFDDDYYPQYVISFSIYCWGWSYI